MPAIWKFLTCSSFLLFAALLCPGLTHQQPIGQLSATCQIPAAHTAIHTDCTPPARIFRHTSCSPHAVHTFTHSIQAFLQLARHAPSADWSFSPMSSRNIRHQSAIHHQSASYQPITTTSITSLSCLGGCAVPWLSFFLIAWPAGPSLRCDVRAHCGSLQPSLLKACHYKLTACECGRAAGSCNNACHVVERSFS